MNKTIKIIIYNIAFIFVVVLVMEAIFFIKYYNNAQSLIKKNNEYMTEISEFSDPTFKDIFVSKYLRMRFLYKNDFRKPQGLQYGKNNKETSPIVLLGCSYMYGYGLEENETLQYFLSEQTKRPVYNWGMVGGGLREILYILRSPKIRSYLSPDSANVKYFIYTYIPSHKNRLFENFRPHVPSFKADKEYKHLKYDKNYLNNKTCMVPEIMKFYYNNFADREKTFELIKLYISQINNSIQKKYTNYDEPAKLIVLVYDDVDNYNWEEIKDENIIIINTKSLSDVDLRSKEYRIADGNHPNKKAWEIITPALIKELNL